jgi:hypothetical protein
MAGCHALKCSCKLVSCNDELVVAQRSEKRIVRNGSELI